MRLQTLWQPWASAMVWGWIRYDTRTWKTTYRGKVAIHSAKRCANMSDRVIAKKCLALIAKAGLKKEGPLGAFPRGSIVAVATLVDIVSTEAMSALLPLPPLERAFGDYGPRRWIWIYEDVHPVGPLPYDPERGLFQNLPEDVEAKLEHAASLSKKDA